MSARTEGGDIVLRVARNRNFRTISLHATNNESLSLKAKGLHTLLVTRPDGWVFSESHLVGRSRDGRDSFRAAMVELEDAGYLVREKQGRVEGGGFARREWTIHEEPCGDTDVYRVGKPGDGFPGDGKPDAVSNIEGGSIDGGKEPSLGSHGRPDEEPKPRRPRTTREPACDCPEGFQANEAQVQKMIEHGLDVEDQVEQFRLHHEKKGNQWAGTRGWTAALWLWINNAIRWGAERKGGGRPGAQASLFAATTVGDLERVFGGGT